MIKYKNWKELKRVIKKPTVLESEVTFLSQHKKLLKKLLEIQPSEPKNTLDISGADFDGLDVRYVEFLPLGIDNQFEYKAPLVDRDFVNFDYDSVGSEYACYMAATRQHYKAAIPFGPVEDWMIWYMAGEHLVKCRAVGQVSALRSNFMDVVTQLIARDAGVVIGKFTPVLMIKSREFEALKSVMVGK